MDVSGERLMEPAVHDESTHGQRHWDEDEDIDMDIDLGPTQNAEPDHFVSEELTTDNLTFSNLN